MKNKARLKALINQYTEELGNNQTMKTDKFGHKLLRLAEQSNPEMLKSERFRQKVSRANFLVDIPDEYFDAVITLLSCQNAQNTNKTFSSIQVA